MTSTPEYTAVIIYYDTLVLALALNPLEVANKLVAKEVINHEMQEYMNLESITNYKKSSKLVNKIACKIKEDKASFYQVLQCLSGIRWTQKASRELKQHLVGMWAIKLSTLS